MYQVAVIIQEENGTVKEIDGIDMEIESTNWCNCVNPNDGTTLDGTQGI